MTVVAFSPRIAWGLDTVSVSRGTRTLNGSGEYYAIGFVIPKSGTITKIAFQISAITSSQDLVVGLETVGSDGIPTGTDYGGSSAGTITPTTGHSVVTLGTAATASRGDVAQAVIRWSGTEGDLNLSYFSGAVRSVMSSHYYDGTNNATNDGPMLLLGYDDDTWEAVHPNVALNDGTTYSETLVLNGDDEAGLLFRVPTEMRLIGATAFVRELGSGADAVELALRSVGEANENGTELSSSKTLYDNASRITNGNQLFLLDTPYVCAADTDYRLTIHCLASRATDYYVSYISLSDANMRGAYFSTDCQLTKWDGAAWTNESSQLPLMQLLFDSVPGVSGGVMLHPGMNGGLT